jgi:hypothetical protein
MENFTRFENQYILMLAVRARQDLVADMKEQSGYKDPNLQSYVDSLESIVNKAKLNMREYDSLKKQK